MFCFDDIHVDFCSLFDGVFRLRFSCFDFVVDYDYDPGVWSCLRSPVVKVERIDTFVPSYLALRPCPLTEDVFYLDLPTAFGYRSSRGKWLTTGTHHARVFFDIHSLFRDS